MSWPSITNNEMLLRSPQAVLGLVVILLLSACGQPQGPRAMDDRAIADEDQTSDWLAYGRTHNERRFSPLTSVNTANVAHLKVDWYIDLPRDRGLVSTPLVVAGTLYFVGTMNVVRAVDAKSGELIWEYDPQVAKHVGRKRRVGWTHNRGLSFYEGSIFTATWDGRLIALDAETGKELWSATTIDPDKPLYITGAPKAFKGKVLIGNGGTENGPSRGFVTAYDARTGKEAWKFYIVPGNPADGFENEAMEMAAKTWTGDWWRHGGGGNAWHGFTYDADLDVLYIGTGNGSPWNRKIRSPDGGDNLFLCSIVALDPDTGEYLWHYQTTPGESWDYNSNMDIVLADLAIDGREVKALLHAPKNGFFYVIDRETGKLISAKPFVETTWASHVDLKTGRPVEIPGARYEEGPAMVTPGAWGAHSWHAMSYNPQTGLVYVPTIHSGLVYTDEGIDLESWQSVDFVGGEGVDVVPAETPPRDYPGSLQAWDPVKQEQVWSVPQQYMWNAGTLTTAGNLVFQGRADGQFVAYDAENGKVLWTFDAGLGISAPPITYQIEGRQYIALLVGWGGGFAGLIGTDLGWTYGMHTRRLVVFSLDGTTELPALPPPHHPVPLQDDTFAVDEELARQGAGGYRACRACHGFGAIAGGMAPDLRASHIALDQDAFAAYVREGVKASMGMPVYPDLTDDQLTALMHFIRQRAVATRPSKASGEAAL